MCMSPTIFEIGNIKFVVFFRDHNPPHLHVLQNSRKAIFTISGKLLKNSGFSNSDITKLIKFIMDKENNKTLLEAWEAYCE